MAGNGGKAGKKGRGAVLWGWFTVTPTNMACVGGYLEDHVFVGEETGSWYLPGS